MLTRMHGESDIDYIEKGTNKIDRNGLILEYDIKTNHYEIVPNIAKDMSNNENDAVFTNAKYNEGRNGVIFDGTSTYAQLSLKQNLTFPMTIETTIACTEAQTSLIYLEPISQTALGMWEDYFIVTIYEKTLTIPIPLDFFNGEIKHIVITYNSLTDFEFYINGQKLDKNTSIDAWATDVGTISYLGRRQRGDYFKGIMYEFRIYNTILSENEIMENYKNIKY